MSSALRTWGGRFSGDMDTLTRDYTAGVDAGLYEHDIAGSVAHARMLGKQGVIPTEDADSIVAGLALVLEDFRGGRVTWRVRILYRPPSPPASNSSLLRPNDSRFSGLASHLHDASGQNRLSSIGAAAMPVERWRLRAGGAKMLRRSGVHT